MARVTGSKIARGGAAGYCPALGLHSQENRPRLLIPQIPRTAMSTPSSDTHHRIAAERGPVAVAVVTVSDTRTPQSDENGAYLRARIEGAGHAVAGYRVVRDDPAEVAAALEEALAGPARVVIFNGGTGIAPRDNTFDVLDARLEKRIPGFGELFRMLSWEQVGSAAMLSRATAGVCRERVVVSLPGAPAAVRLAWERLLEPEIAHLAWQVAGPAA